MTGAKGWDVSAKEQARNGEIHHGINIRIAPNREKYMKLQHAEEPGFIVTSRAQRLLIHSNQRNR